MTSWGAMKRFLLLRSNTDGSSAIEIVFLLGLVGVGLNFCFPGLGVAGHMMLRTAGRTFGWW